MESLAIKKIKKDLLCHYIMIKSPGNRKSWRVLLATLILYIACVILLLMKLPFLIKFLVALFFSLIVERLFMIFHDCCHGSFLNNKKKNNRLAHFLSMLIITPVSQWSKGHNFHHRHYGNNFYVDIGQTLIPSHVYDALSARKRFLLRCFRSPVVFFVVFPLLHWFICYPFLKITTFPNAKPLTIFRYPLYGVGFLLLIALSIYVSPFYFFSYYMSGFLGVLLFHLQHAANPINRFSKETWNPSQSALQGSTVMCIPSLLKWVTLGLEYHHIHHLFSHLPGYYLQALHESIPNSTWKENGVVFVKAATIFSALNNTIWDEKNNVALSFTQYQQSSQIS